jgi:hypothetical protein
MHQIAVSLEDLYKGKTSKLAVTRNIICVTCKGYGFYFYLFKKILFLLQTSKDENTNRSFLL